MAQEKWEVKRVAGMVGLLTYCIEKTKGEVAWALSISRTLSYQARQSLYRPTTSLPLAEAALHGSCALLRNLYTHSVIWNSFADMMGRLPRSQDSVAFNGAPSSSRTVSFPSRH